MTDFTTRAYQEGDTVMIEAINNVDHVRIALFKVNGQNELESVE